MDYFKPFSADTQAAFFSAEAEMIRFGERAAQLPHAEYLKNTMLAIDAVFAIRMVHDVALPPVPLIVLFDVAGWKFDDDVERCLASMRSMLWVSSIAKPGFEATLETVVRLNEILLFGVNSDERAHGFRKTYLPYKKGSVPLEIPREMRKLCDFCNGEYFSPLGQASVIHHAFERIVPFDSMIDRTGLLFAFMPMFRRGLFANELMVPICWGASLERDYRRILKDASRKELTSESHKVYKEQWAAYNARNTSMGVVIANMFISKVSKLRDSWRSRGLKIPANSATDRLLDLFLAVPQLATRHAASCIGKSYGATNEAMRQLVKAGIVKEVAVDNRERVFVCEQSAALIADFVDNLEKVGEVAAEPGE